MLPTGILRDRQEVKRRVRQEIHTHGISERAHAPEISALLEHYSGFAMDGLGAPYAAFNLAALDQYRDNLVILMPDKIGDYAYLHYGRDIIRASGFDMTGRRVSNLPPEMAISTIRSLDRALELGCALYIVQRTMQTTLASVWESLLLPVVTEAGDRYVTVFTKPIEFREQLLSTVLDASNDGIFALSPIRTQDNRIEDAMITTANRRGAEIIGSQITKLINRSALKNLPILTENNLWERCLTVMETGQIDRFETNYTIGERQFWFQIALTGLEGGLVMTLTDVTDLKMANLALQSHTASLAIEIGRERASVRALSTEISAREQREIELRRLAETDSLTGLLNRGTFETYVAKAMTAAQHVDAFLTVIVLDLDHFKSINDTFGHATGDIVLKATAEKLGLSVRRGSDLVGRMGGEEFAICLPRAEGAHGSRIAESLRAAIAGMQIVSHQGKIIRVTASFGVATLVPGESFRQIFARADQALYQAKKMGRNRVRFAEPERKLLQLT